MPGFMSQPVGIQPVTAIQRRQNHWLPPHDDLEERTYRNPHRLGRRDPDHTAASIAYDSTTVFTRKDETLQEYWWCTEWALDWGPDGGLDLIVDKGGDATLLIHEGVKAEEEFEKTGKLPDPASTDNAEFQIVLSIIKEGLQIDPKKYHKMKERLVGVSEETITGVKSLY
ncbi:hypothetical protein R6Q59_009508 [Mikania micrantha]